LKKISLKGGHFKLWQHCTPEVRSGACIWAERTSAVPARVFGRNGLPPFRRVYLGGTDFRPTFVQAQKKRGARLRRVGFPVYNLMKSFKSGVNVLPLLFVSPPFLFIDGTKVKHICTTTKNRKSILLNGCLAKNWA
jgi:hypothetical protein